MTADGHRDGRRGVRDDAGDRAGLPRDAGRQRIAAERDRAAQGRDGGERQRRAAQPSAAHREPAAGRARRRRPAARRRPSSSSSSRCRGMSDNQPANVPVRGVGPAGVRRPRIAELRRRPPLHAGHARDQRRPAGGRPLQGARRSAATSSSAARPGRSSASSTADDAAFESEVWGDVDLMMPAFQRNGYQSVTVKLTDPSAFESLRGGDRRRSAPAPAAAARAGLLRRAVAGDDDGDPRVRHVRHADSVDRRDVRRDEHDVRGGRLPHARDRHAARARLLARCGSSTAFLAESIALALVGGVIGCLLALPVHGLSTGTTNMASFSEVAFKFRITPALLAGGLIFSALMGAAGGLLPAIRAARIPVARALREI